MGDRLPIPAAQARRRAAARPRRSRPCCSWGRSGGRSTPFLFFSDHVEPQLRDSEGERRQREFEGFGYAWEAPDPSEEETFLRSKLDWSELKDEEHWSLLCWYRDLIALRRALPELSDPRLDRVRVDHDPDDRGWSCGGGRWRCR